ncbi:MAG: hypothetical protein Tsb0018_00800 [Opitutales bacterium]|mgnify:FL=1|tara:strand:+ start:45 stop:1238 length:1194 start_codon:yes stop_codon:yes gene_type:complete
MSTFNTLGLLPEIERVITECGYETPTEVQARAIPIILECQDIIASSQTGTGKTAAFALPVLTLLRKPKRQLRCLILEPTRELAKQVYDNFCQFNQHLNLSIALIHGGVRYGKQRQELETADVVIATPGRLLDHLSQETAHLDKLEILVLDEVDRMLDMGFIDEVKAIFSFCPQKRQTLFFSATMPEKIRQFARWALNEPKELTIGQRQAPAKTIEHCIYPIHAIQKFDLLVQLIKQECPQSALVFCKTKEEADRLTRWLAEYQFNVAALHADRKQSERQKALDGFKQGKYSLLVATDIASRGLDVSGIELVINYNVPHNAEDYVHRIGRTGRAAREGKAYTLFSSEEFHYLKNIEMLIDSPIEQRVLEGFPYRSMPRIERQPTKRARRNTGSARRRR